MAARPVNLITFFVDKLRLSKPVTSTKYPSGAALPASVSGENGCRIIHDQAELFPRKDVPDRRIEPASSRSILFIGLTHIFFLS